MKTLLSSLLLLLLARPLAAEDLLLYAPMDGRAEAQFARGDRTAASASSPEFQPGVRGQALLVGGARPAADDRTAETPQRASLGRHVSYASEGNIDVEKGTISFWVKPLDWSGEDHGFNVLLRTQAGPHHFMIYKFFSREQLLFLRGEHEQWTRVIHRIGDWHPGQWRHIAVTWSPDEMRMFIDGVLISVHRVRFPLDNAVPVQPISVGPGGSWSHAFIGHSLIDELRIHGRPLTHEQIIELYRLDAANVEFDAGHITIGRCTPQIDGQVVEHEYAFAGTGFADLKGIFSSRQSRYFLGYDSDNLYLAVQSEISPDALAPQLRDGDMGAIECVELFLTMPAAPQTLRHWVFAPNGTTGQVQADDVRWGAAQFQAESLVADGVWTLEAAIPLASLGEAGPPDARPWRINIARTFTSPPEITSVAPVVGALADRNRFVRLHFRPDAPRVHIGGLFDLVDHRAAYDFRALCDDPTSEIEYVGISDNTSDYGLRVSRHPLFSKGLSTPFQAPRPPANGWPLADFAHHEAQITEHRNGHSDVLYRARFMYERQTPLTTLFLYTLDRRQLSVTARRRADGLLRAYFLRPDQTVAWEASQAIPRDATIFNAVFDLDLDRLGPGDYIVKIDHISPSGEATETHEQEYRVPATDSPAFRQYIDPEADQVPSPWVPVDAEPDRVRVWGRQYDFSDGFLFASLQSQGHELLTAPASLCLNGRTLIPQRPIRVRKMADGPLKATWHKVAELGPLTVSSDITTHFDGYCEVSMTLTPTTASCDIQTLSFDVPLRGELAALVRDSRTNELTGSKTGAVGDYWSQKLIDNPFIWVGSEQAGFNWLASALEDWHCRVHAKNVEILREGDTAVLRFNIVDKPLALGEPRTIRFGFVVTPSRPLDRRINRCRLHRDWELWCQPWQYFAVPDYDTADRRVIEQKGEGVKEVFLYLGDGFISPFSPEWPYFEHEWRELRPARTYGEWTGAQLRGPLRARHGYTEACVRSETFRNYVNNTRAEFFAKAKTPLTPKAINYYFDTGVIASLCSNSRHGCAPFEGIDGARYGRIPIDERRELALNAYRMIRRTGPDAKIMSHQGWTRCMPLQHFTDVIIGGEGVGSQVGNAGNYFNVLTPELFRATYSPYVWGMKMAFLDMTVRAMKEDRPQRLIGFNLDDRSTRRGLLHSYGYCVLHDVDIYDAAKESRPLRELLWQAQDELGWDDRVEFHPYWEAGPVVVKHPVSNRVMASAYTKDSKMLLAVLNDTDSQHEVVIELDAAVLGLPPTARGTDVFQPEDKVELGPTCTLVMPPRGFRLLLVVGP